MKDFILHKRHAVSKDKCDRIINYFETHKESQHVGTVGGRGIEPDRKISTEMLLSLKNGPLTEPSHLPPREVFSLFGEFLVEAVEVYKKQYPFLDIGLNSWTFYENYKIQKYNPNEGYFALHCENDGVGLEEIKRVLAWMIYLNDVTDGGHTEFPSQNKKFQPRRGDILIWPAGWTHPHRGVTSKSQTKYIVTGWYSYL